MERIPLNGTLPPPNQNQGSVGVRRSSVQSCCLLLNHSCACRDGNCSYQDCKKMKRALRHTRMCWRKLFVGCTICKKMVALCCRHAQDCEEVHCPVLFCSAIKSKLRRRFCQQLRSQLWLLKGMNMGG